MFGVMGWQSPWLGGACRQLVKVATLTPHEQCLTCQRARKNSLTTPAELPHQLPSIPTTCFSPCLIFFLHYSSHVISMISFEGDCPDTAPHCLFILIFPTCVKHHCFFCPPFHLHVLQSIKTKRKKSFRLSRKFPFYKSKENLAQESSGQERK